jgi:hypothetical protein
VKKSRGRDHEAPAPHCAEYVCDFRGLAANDVPNEVSIPILAPFPNVSMNVKEPPSVGKFAPARFCVIRLMNGVAVQQ